MFVFVNDEWSAYEPNCKIFSHPLILEQYYFYNFVFYVFSHLRRMHAYKKIFHTDTIWVSVLCKAIERGMTFLEEIELSEVLKYFRCWYDAHKYAINSIILSGQTVQERQNYAIENR